MLKKRKARELAMQVLFLWDAHGANDVDMARQAVAEGSDDDEVRRAGLEMATGTWSQRETIDARIERLAPQWPPRRQPGVDRSLIRLAVWELTNADTPPKVVIDEAIELAKQFSTEQSPAFVNGVLDAVLKEHKALAATNPPAAPTFSFARLAEKPEPVAAAAPTPIHEARPSEPVVGDSRAALHRVNEQLATDLLSLFLPDRRIDDNYLREVRSRLSESGLPVAQADPIVGAIRSRWQSGQIHTSGDVLAVVRNQINSILGAAAAAAS